MSSIVEFVQTNISDQFLKNAILKGLKDRDKKAIEINETIAKKLDSLAKLALAKLGVELLPKLVFINKGSRSVVGVYGREKYIKVHSRLLRQKPDYIMDRALPSEYARLVAISLVKTPLDRTDIRVRRVKKILTGDSRIAATIEPEVFTQYLYRCACRCKWLNEHRHNFIHKYTNPSKVVCVHCSNVFTFQNETREIKPDVVIKEARLMLVAYLNATREIILRGVKMDYMKEALLKKGYQSVAVA